jgi:hypothetical protein
MLRPLTVRVASTTPNLLEIYSIKIDCATSFPVVSPQFPGTRLNAAARHPRRNYESIYAEAHDFAGHFVAHDMGCMMKARHT